MGSSDRNKSTFAQKVFIMIDGKDYENDFCDECKVKIAEETAKLSLLDKMRPLRVAKKFSKIICKECNKKIRMKLNTR